MPSRASHCGCQTSCLANTYRSMSEIQTNTARQCADLIRTGTLTSKSLVRHYTDNINANNETVRAWVDFDEDKAAHQANTLDDIRKRGQPTGPLHGIPVGLKDIYDTTEFATQYGSPVHAQHQPEKDCAVVEKLREAGAVVMGKTVTTEFAFMHPSDTRNPHNAKHSPGGSSSGSAAAVAAGHVPLAIGSQTNGSVIRPASFCGVYGFKPSRGIISRRGVLATSNTLDQVGVFARDIGDIALLTDTLAGYDAADTASYTEPKPQMLQGYLAEVPVEPNIAWLDMPYAAKYSEDAAQGFEELLDALDGNVERLPTPQSFAALLPCHKIIHEYEIVRCLKDQIDNHWDQISDTIKPVLLAAKNHTDEQYQEALTIKTAAEDWFKEFFNDYDAILTPSALSEAPLLGDGTGDPVCCTIWTLCGLPCINLPLLTGINDLPVGVQLVGAFRQDDRLLRTTRHLIRHLNTIA